LRGIIGRDTLQHIATRFHNKGIRARFKDRLLQWYGLMERILLIAVDIGNSRLKCGVFNPEGWQEKSPVASRVVSVSLSDLDRQEFADELGAVIPEKTRTVWWIASVNRPATTKLLELIRRKRSDDEIILVASSDLPLKVAVPHPDRVGIDRLAAAVGANMLRDSAKPAVVVGVGTAVTVNAISRDGVFLGGAIACGAAMSARAMHQFTDLLPLIPTEWETPPDPIGVDTPSAMAAGIFWGLVGTVRELVKRQAVLLGGDPEIFVTGGGGRLLADELGEGARFIDTLTLMGIAVAARVTLEGL